MKIVAPTSGNPIRVPQDVPNALAMSFAPDFLQGTLADFARTTTDQVHVLDCMGRVVWANASALRAARVGSTSPGEWVWAQSWPSVHRPRAIAAMHEALKQGTARFVAPSLHEGRRRVFNVTLTRIALSDETEKFVIAITGATQPADDNQEEYRRGGTVDGLTGLPNAVWFHKELNARTARGRQIERPFALALIDIDGFKLLNSRLGPQRCDALLERFANLISETADESWAIARSGGDEFALIIEEAQGVSRVPQQVFRLIQRCAYHISTLQSGVSFSVSAGISRSPADATTDQELMRNAHAALHAAKAAGRGRCVSFDGAMRQRLQRHSSMLEVARAGIAGDWMRPYYQPKVDLSSGKVIGLEALLRWQSADGVVHLPSSISAAFEDPEVATRISDLMLQKIITDVTAWKRAGSTLPVAINASGADFHNAQFADIFLRKLRDADLPTHLFELEITEGVFLGTGADAVGAALRKLNAAGVRIALDDFGTGYASLTHLKQQPVDVIKIDRSFISNLTASPDDRAIVGAMISLSKNLAIEVVAEGIETETQASFLRSLGCNTGQGFLFSHAVPGAAVPDLPKIYRSQTAIALAAAGACALGL